MDLNKRLPHVDASRFSMVPRAQIPRSTFVTQHSLKTTFKTGLVIPIHVDECLPGDVHQGNLNIFARLSPLLFPVMDNMTLETFFFYVPSRLLWTHFVNMMGQRNAPSDSISFTIPQCVSGAGGFNVCSLYDYMGLPTAGQVGAGNQKSVNALPLRAYNLIWNEWFRDQNLQNPIPNNTGDGPDSNGDYLLQSRNKKHDYFTSCLPWPLKGGVDVTLPLGTQAPIKGIAFAAAATGAGGTSGNAKETSGTTVTYPHYQTLATAGSWYGQINQEAAGATPQIYADLSSQTGATINALRTAFQTQRLLERDARGGTRYTELLLAHFGVDAEDYRLQRPEYIGGGKSAIQTSAIPQTSATGLTGGSTPQGSLVAQGLIADKHSFSYHCKEHGYILGLAHVTADLTYQQGLHRLWTRFTRYDIYWPVFQALGEQAVRNDEIYCDGSANDVLTFGYQERWAEYRHRPSRLTGLFRSTSAGTIDPWHLAIKFAALPLLNSSFITDAPPLSRALAGGAAVDNQQILFDSFWTIKCTRAMPMFSVPGMIDHF